MPTPTNTLEKLLDYGRSEKAPKEILLSCCHDLQVDYQFDTVFVAAGPTPEEAPKGIVWHGVEELVTKSLWRIGVEDRIALTQTSYKVIQDVTGPPSFNPHGSLRIQKLGSGFFFALFTPGRGFLLVGGVHKEAKPYPQRLIDDLAGLWKEWREPLWKVVEPILQQMMEEQKKVEAEAQVQQVNLKSKGNGDQVGVVPLDLPENPNLPKRPTVLVDPATHLYNRSYFDESLGVEVERAKRYKRCLTLILLAVTPNEKTTFDEDAHLAEQATETLVKSLRKIDILCRLDRTMYALLLPDTPHQHGTVIARRVFKQFKTLMGDKPIAHLNLSAAEFPLHAPNASALLVKAEEFMAKAVLAGPNKAVLSD